MRQLGWVVCVVLVAAAVTGTVLYGQDGGGGGGGTGTGPGAIDPERMKMALAAIGLSPEEAAAAGKSLEVKMKARQALTEELGKLRQVADDQQATNEQLTAATTAYTKALAKYRMTVESEDSAFAKQLSPRSYARSLVAGLVDNGLGAGRPRMGGGGGGHGGGGPGGGTPPPPPHE